MVPDDPRNTTGIISCVAPEPLRQCADKMWLSYGIHPWYTHGHDIDRLLEIVNEAAPDKRVLAIGEAGIDKVRGPALGLQKKIFCQQIKISEDHHKPLIIHSVKANNEILELHKKMAPSQPWILHGFGGHPQEMKQFTDEGFYLSFGPKILYPDHKTADSLKKIPCDRFFLETDYTNKSIMALYDKAAEIRETTIKKLGETINNNFKTVMGASVIDFID
jgi:TatD DNase family protein